MHPRKGLPTRRPTDPIPTAVPEEEWVMMKFQSECDECGRKFSTKLKVCPHCGYEEKIVHEYRKRVRRK